MQSNRGYIDLLPAIPSVWANGSVSGLLAEGGFEVDMSWTNSTLEDLTITSTNGGICSVEYPAPANGKVVKITCDGADVAYTVEDGIYTFDTVADGEYVFTVKNAPAAIRNSDGSVTITWEPKDGVTYTVYRKEKAN